MSKNQQAVSANQAWLSAIDAILSYGVEVSPRGKKTLEIPQRTFICNMLKPVVTNPDRKLNYRFMAAEAFWILSGDDSVAGIAEYNKNISQFSDDGVVFAGAYGPMIQSQFQYVVDKLVSDRDTRQAGLTIWKPNPKPSKDIPCTVSIFFQIRGSYLNCHVFMRSSDAWLGLPYDTFTFSMVAAKVCAYLNQWCINELRQLTPGNLYITAASSHLYEEHFESARSIIDGRSFFDEYDPVNMSYDMYTNEENLMRVLKLLRNSDPEDQIRWWNK